MGRLRPVQRAHVRLVNGTLIHIPHVPTLLCDVCGQIEYDEHLLRRFDVLIGESGPPPNTHPTGDAHPPSAPDDPPDTLHPPSK